MTDEAGTISEWGEKRIIREIILPLFNPQGDPYGVGDDCAVLHPLPGQALLLSTDRVPADLLAFKHAVIDYQGFGSHLAAINISDIAASGGSPAALLLNFGLPANLRVSDLVALCEGVLRIAGPVGCVIAGGDISSATELSVSATSIGFAPIDQILLRNGAMADDLVFFSRPAGLTPAAFWMLTTPDSSQLLDQAAWTELTAHLSGLRPMVDLGWGLGESGLCTSCMDNTDGLAQTLTELGEASGVGVELDQSAIDVPPVVRSVAALCGQDSYDFALSAGHDFSLVGTIRPDTPPPVLAHLVSLGVRIVGKATERLGIRLRSNQGIRDCVVPGWNYFSSTERTITKRAQSEVSEGHGQPT